MTREYEKGRTPIMIISDRFIFVHVPKTGGQSMTRALPGNPTAPTHTPLFKIPGRKGKPSFGFVRNPWDRMVSLYFFMCQKSMTPRYIQYQRDLNEKGFKWWLMEDRYFMEREEGWSDGLNPMQRRPQMFWLNGCDHIGRFETMREDFNRITRELDIKHTGLPHINQSKHAEYQKYYDDETQAFVAEHFAPDIERFGYTFA